MAAWRRRRTCSGSHQRRLQQRPASAAGSSVPCHSGGGAARRRRDRCRSSRRCRCRLAATVPARSHLARTGGGATRRSRRGRACHGPAPSCRGTLRSGPCPSRLHRRTSPHHLRWTLAIRQRTSAQPSPQRRCTMRLHRWTSSPSARRPQTEPPQLVCPPRDEHGSVARLASPPSATTECSPCSHASGNRSPRSQARARAAAARRVAGVAAAAASRRPIPSPRDVEESRMPSSA